MADAAGDTAPDRLAGPLAHELDAAAAMLETLSADLCGDPAVFERHFARLQGFDQLAQTVREIAGALRHPGSSTEAVGAIRLDALRTRIALALDGGPCR